MENPNCHDVPAPTGVTGTRACITVFRAKNKHIDFVATRADSIGKPVTLASLGYTGGVNESIY